MKKIIFAAALISVLLPGCSTIEFNVGVPSYAESADGVDSEITMWDLGISGDIEITDFVGIGLYESSTFPQRIKTTEDGLLPALRLLYTPQFF
ncbi:MAG: hypothetical protein LBK13_13280 [Spirochaetales bacterium]|jgi:hypothetical protein|nr:hypothetical protein [Spirochaetales bacterium]